MAFVSISHSHINIKNFHVHSKLTYQKLKQKRVRLSSCGKGHQFFILISILKIVPMGEIFLKSSRKSQKCHPRFQIWMNFTPVGLVGSPEKNNEF
jgi:hypothetical protein